MPLQWSRIFDGLKLMLWGFFKKIVIADRLALYVNAVYGDPSAHSGIALLTATYFFAFQLYCDFSGYSDIAVGAARVMGYDLMENFRRPFYAKSIAEFWRRWHISLSTWFRDYVYVPLGGNRVSRSRAYLNLMVVFVLSGLWHGADWSMLIWGALHGFYIIFAMFTQPRRDHIWATVHDAYDLWQPAWGKGRRTGDSPGHRSWSTRFERWMKVLITFHLFVFSLIFFRAASLDDAALVFRGLLDGAGWTRRLFVGLSPYEFLLALGGIAVLQIVHFMERKENMRSFLSARSPYVRYPVYVMILLALLMFGEFGAREFIYFQF
jgi:alginate O-acetyltransferase complex protein AlgI